MLPADTDSEDDAAITETVRSAPEGVLRRFVVAALLVQGGLFAVSLGAMLAAFRGQKAVGGTLIVGGAALLALSWWVYRRQQAQE